jgi:hypothetical protein
MEQKECDCERTDFVYLGLHGHRLLGFLIAGGRVGKAAVFKSGDARTSRRLGLVIRTSKCEHTFAPNSLCCGHSRSKDVEAFQSSSKNGSVCSAI